MATRDKPMAGGLNKVADLRIGLRSDAGPQRCLAGRAGQPGAMQLPGNSRETEIQAFGQYVIVGNDGADVDMPVMAWRAMELH